MTLTLTLDDSRAALLTQDAARGHVPVETVLASLITTHCDPPAPPVSKPYKVRVFHSEFQTGVELVKLKALLDEEEAERFDFAGCKSLGALTFVNSGTNRFAHSIQFGRKQPSSFAADAGVMGGHKAMRQGKTCQG